MDPLFLQGLATGFLIGWAFMATIALLALRGRRSDEKKNSTPS